MKSVASSFLLLLLGACVVPAQNPPPAAPVPSGPGAPAPAGSATPAACVQEGNADAGDFDQPMEIGAGTITGCASPSDKVDTFVLKAPDSATSTLYTFQLTPTKTMIARLYDAQRAQKVWQDAPAGQLSSLWAVVTAGSTFYLKVEHHYSSDPENPYTLAVTATPLPEADEPNDDFTTAAPLALAAPYRAAAVNAIDNDQLKVDYYRIDVPRAGKLTVRLTDATPTLQLRMGLFDPNRGRIAAASSPNPGALFEVTAKAKAKGTYYVKIAPSYSSFKAADKGEVPTPMPSTYTLSATLD